MSSPRSADGAEPRRVAVLGSTGSIGQQTLDVLALHLDAFRVVALAAGSNGQQLAAQAEQFGVSVTAFQLRLGAEAVGDAAASPVGVGGGVTS